MYALMKDFKVMCRSPTGAVWKSIREKLDREAVFTWPSRAQAEEHRATQGGAVIPINSLLHIEVDDAV